MAEKLRSVFLPLILLAIALAAGMALLNWILLRTGWLVLDEDVAAVWLPVGLAIVAVGFLIAPRLHVLVLNPTRNIPMLYIMVAIVCVAGPAILVQEYVQATMGEMVTVRDGAAIPLHPVARYFTVGSVCLNKPGALPHPRVSVAGDHDEDLNIDLYAAVPFCDAPVWLALSWHKTIDNNLGDAKKDALYRDFAKRCERALDQLDPRSIRFYERVGHNSFHRALEKALKKGKPGDAAPIFLIPHTEPFAEQAGNWLVGAIIALMVAAALWLFMMLVVPLKPLDDRQPSPPSGVSALFVPHRESFGLPLLVDANLLVFLAMVLSGLGFLSFEIDDLIAWGASSGDLDHGWGLLRLVTATFVHAGFFHIAGNMYGLLFGGAMLSTVARNTRLLFIYFVSGIGGSLLSKTVHPDIVMVGASGAIFGFFGALVALVLLRDPKMLAIRVQIILNVGIFLVLNVLYGISTPGVDNFAHIGGFLTGLVCGAAIYILDRREARVTA